MTDKAYIVANEEQEREVLIDLENQGYTWDNLVRSKPTLHVHKLFDGCEGFPYALFANENNHRIRWDKVELSNGLEIAFDGRKEQQMSDKYVVSQEFMNELKGWKHDLILENAFFVNREAINNMPKIIKNWWIDDYVAIGESNKRLISIIRYMSGANDFEVEKPKKWAVRSKATDNDGDYRYVSVFDSCFGITYADSGKDKLENATHFDTKEEAESWANAHQEVVEVEE